MLCANYPHDLTMLGGSPESLIAMLWFHCSHSRVDLAECKFSLGSEMSNLLLCSIVPRVHNNISNNMSILLLVGTPSSHLKESWPSAYLPIAAATGKSFILAPQLWIHGAFVEEMPACCKYSLLQDKALWPGKMTDGTVEIDQPIDWFPFAHCR